MGAVACAGTLERTIAPVNTCYSIEEMHTAARAARYGGLRLGFAPTMGALHEGHLSLVRTARAQSDAVAVSIFVNPTQFGPNEDFSNYPRTLERDRELLEKEGVDLLFAPSAEDMYPKSSVTWVEIPELSQKLCGRSRPGHFRGVTTVVSKLFHIVEPDLAFFGQKDAAQVAVIRRMVRDLNFPIEIVVCPIVREPDGLAMSSRNVYLSPQERKSALALHHSLTAIKAQFDLGERKAAHLTQMGKQVLADEPGVQVDYLEIVDPDTLDPMEELNRPTLVAVAGFVGKTRLIDNVVLPSN